jgi:hypothetical protein
VVNGFESPVAVFVLMGGGEREKALEWRRWTSKRKMRDCQNTQHTEQEHRL